MSQRTEGGLPLDINFVQQRNEKCIHSDDCYIIRAEHTCLTNHGNSVNILISIEKTNEKKNKTRTKVKLTAENI